MKQSPKTREPWILLNDDQRPDDDDRPLGPGDPGQGPP